MSYSLMTKCFDCIKAPRCTDRHVLTGAVTAIHAMPYGQDFGHMGYGTIDLYCGAYEKKPEEAK